VICHVAYSEASSIGACIYPDRGGQAIAYVTQRKPDGYIIAIASAGALAISPSMEKVAYDTPPQAVAALNKATVEAMKDPAVVEELASQGAVLEGQTPEQFRAFLDSEIKKWAKVIKDAGVHTEKYVAGGSGGMAL
jgi:hypothetical protein